MSKELRVLIPDDVMRRFRIVCLQKELSVPKQTEELIRHFVEIQENNIAIDKTMKKV